MKFVDLSGNSRMARMMDLTRDLRNCQSPYEALLMYVRYLRDVLPGRAHLVLSTVGLAAGQYRVWRLLGDDGVEHVELCNPWEGLNLPVYSGGTIAKIIENRSPNLVNDLDWRDDPNFAQLLGPYRSLMAVPLFNEGLPLNWSLGLTRGPDSFTVNQLEDSATRATLVGSLLGSLQVSRALSIANAHIEAELHRMARIQRALLPEPIPEIPGLRLAASYETFGQVGGDLYDFFPLKADNSLWCMFIGDASGHGPSAAVVAAMVQATLLACAADSSGPADLLQTLNRRLCQKRIEGSFLTAFVGFYEPASRRLRYASAGHPVPPLLPTRAGHPTRFLDAAGGPPLGIDDGASFDEAMVELPPGYTLLLYTDGISEARAPDGAMFGEEGIEQSLQNRGDDAQGVINRLRDSLVTHQRGRRPNDDQTAVAIQTPV
jgi:sigma-B regulation protein RsbU (phosphoserine phosphatase)